MAASLFMKVTRFEWDGVGTDIVWDADIVREVTPTTYNATLTGQTIPMANFASLDSLEPIKRQLVYGMVSWLMSQTSAPVNDDDKVFLSGLLGTGVYTNQHYVQVS